MSSPKHLWSGDWERESQDLTPPPPARVVQNPEPPAVPDAASEPPRGPRRMTILTVAAVVIVLAAVGVTLAATLGGSKTQTISAQTPTTSSGNSGSGGAGLGNSGSQFPTVSVPNGTTSTPQSTPQTQGSSSLGTQVTAGPSYGWLGMEIAAIGSGVTVETVSIGSAADTAGVDPGDVIESVNGTQVASISQLQSVLNKLKTGSQFSLVVDRGSTAVTITATLSSRPSRS